MTNGHRHRFALPAGYTLHWYEIHSVLGQGGFGITYRARDTNLNQWVAIKEFLPSDLAARTHDSSVEPISEGHTDTYGWGLERFVTEAQTLAKFRHPNIVLVYSVFEANNTAYMVMEYVEGRTLEDALKFNKVKGEAELKRIVFAILDGLELIHKEGFIHRDIKPDNIYLRDDGNPVLLDFGSARQALGGKTRTLTALVSPGYAPYEQYDSSRDGETKQGPWTDIYALGATLYRAVSGNGPIDAMARVNAAMVGDDLFQPATSIASGEYSGPFLSAIDWALALRPPERPQSIDVWRKALSGELQPDTATEIARPPVQKPAPTTSKVDTTPITSRAAREVPKPKTRTNLPWVLGGAAAVLALAVGAGWWFTRSGAPVPPSVPAEVVSSAAPVTEPPQEPVTTPVEPQLAADPAQTPQRDALIRLLELADADFAAGRYTHPPGDNALERYMEVLKRDPGNGAASEGKDKVFAHFVQLAQTSINKESFSDAEKALSRAEAVEPGSVAVRLARLRLKDAKAAAELRASAERQVRAQQALAQKQAAETQLKRTEEIRTLLLAANKDFEGLRLTSPPGNNAFERFRSVLELDPENDTAREGLIEIVKRYVGLNEEAVKKQDFDKAENYLQKAGEILPGSELVAAARDRFETARADDKRKQAERAAAEAAKREAEKLAKAQAEIEQLKAAQASAQQPPPITTPQPNKRPVPFISNLRTAVLPVAYRRVPGFRWHAGERTWNNTVVVRHVRNTYGRLDLTYAYGEGTLEDPILSNAGKVWIRKSAAREEPNLELIYERAAKLPVDVVVMAWLEPEQGASQWPAEYYVIDVPNRRVFHDVGKAGKYGNAISVLRNLSGDLIAARKQASVQTASAPAPAGAGATSSGPAGQYEKHMRCDIGNGDVYEIFEDDGAWRALLNGKKVKVSIDLKTGIVSSDSIYEDCVAPVFVDGEFTARFMVNFSSPTIRGGLKYNASNNSTCTISEKFSDVGLCSGRIVSR